jgi:hypothetical protein
MHHYVLLPKQLSYAIVPIRDSLYEYPTDMDTLLNFRPLIHGLEKRCLFRTAELDTALNDFLGHNDPDFKSTGWHGMILIDEADTARYRKYLLYKERKNQVAKVLIRHQSAKVAFIYLHPSLQKAQVHLQGFGGGSVAVFAKSTTGWVLHHDAVTYIE